MNDRAMNDRWYSQSTAEVLASLDTVATGLSSNQAERRLSRYGPNALPEAKLDSLAILFLRQFQSPLIYVLIGASLVVLILGEVTDALIILFVLFFNATIGTIQEGRAQNTLRALRQFAKTSTTILRDGQEQLLPDELVVPGDLILLQEGQRVPADVRIIEAFNFSVDESALTGEFIPIHKMTDRLAAKRSLVAIADQQNMAFRGTFVTTGRAKAVVVLTGSNTELGEIAQSVGAIVTDIPLKRSIEHLTQQIIVVVGSTSLFLFLLGLIRGHSVREMFATVVSLAVSAIPEGLPIVLTLVLATGVWRMSKRHALVKKLNAVEALGQTTVIAVDKTGTITQNKLVVTSVYTAGQGYTVSGNGYEPKGAVAKWAFGSEIDLHSSENVWRRQGLSGLISREDAERLQPNEAIAGQNAIWRQSPKGKIIQGDTSVDREHLLPALAMAARISVASDSAKVFQDVVTHEWQIAGDPTEAALLVFGMKLGFAHETVSRSDQRVQDFPFDYERKYRASLHIDGGASLLSVAGAPEQVMALCQLTAKERVTIEGKVRDLARQGQRVVAFAYKQHVSRVNIDQLPRLTFGGLFGLQDVLHAEVNETVQRVQRAGIAVVMLTGDHQETAEAIAREAGIFRVGDRVMSGQEIETQTVEKLATQLDGVTVFARVTPEHKLKIVEAYRRRGDVIAMTGDGVNDAPSLVAADLGVAMGVSGTEVAKEASDIVLLDDNFKSIVAAIEEGRAIYVTIKKVITYLFATSAGEILVITSSLFLNLPLPVTAAQIIWLNLVTDGFLDVSLAMEPREEGLLRQRWDERSKSLVDGLMLQRIILFAVVMTLGTLLLLYQFDPIDRIRFSSLALTVLAMFQWFNAWNSRSSVRSVFHRGMTSNRYLLAATSIVVLLQLVALNTPLMQRILHTEPLSVSDWLLSLIVASTALWAEEIRKLAIRSAATSFESKKSQGRV